MAKKRSLSDRLQLVNQAGQLSRAVKKSVDFAPPLSLPQGWEQLDTYLWRKKTVVTSMVPAQIPESVLFPSADAGTLAFIDTETTGLSSGAGSIVFLFGIGRITQGNLAVEQVFLSDFPGEPAFLHNMLETLDNSLVYVSYNGKAFDTQLLRSRCIMNGLRCSFDRQLDLLYPSRRLWSSLLDSCSLNSVESKILGIERQEDVPGAMVPDIYFDFLRSRSLEQLPLVFSHHLQDIISLSLLLAHILAVLANPESFFCDIFQIGRWFLREGDLRGETLLQSEYQGGNSRAGMELAYHLRRTDRLESAADIWSHLAESEPKASLELAKYLEHASRDYKNALQIVEKLLDLESHVRRFAEGSDDRLFHRLKRIKRKMQASTITGSRQSETHP